MPGKLRRRRGGEGLSRETPESSVLPLLEAACLETGVPRPLALQRELVAAGYWEATLLEQWGLVSTLLSAHLAEAPDPLEALFRLSGQVDARVRFFVPAAADGLLQGSPEAALGFYRRLAADPDKRVAEAVQAFGLRPLAERMGPSIVGPLRAWTDDPSPFVRRAAVEATRPRGVWVRHLRWSVEDPALLLPLLRPLRREQDRYPANAVANCLNDISRTRPQLAREVVRGWLDEEPRGPLVAHMAAKGLRSLVKQGDPLALRLLGFGRLEVQVNARLSGGPRVRPNQALQFELEVSNQGPAGEAKLVYEIETPGRVAGRPRRKRYQGRVLRLPAGDRLKVRCRERIFDTRAAPLIDGACRARFFLNGEVAAELAFELARGTGAGGELSAGG
ncbi:MAG: hypothetical protein ISR76_05000 [Planctomycetes bacterium]|nr:hypothetical protein [Planctomycetota bacterium]